jgi:hypothetical protein
MIDVTLPRASVNIDALDEQLRAALGGATSGFSIGRGEVTVHLSDTATPSQIEWARAIIASHDPAALTTSQQAALIRRQKLDQARRDFGASEIDLEAYAGKDELLGALARKIAWLEREIAALRANPETTPNRS